MSSTLLLRLKISLDIGKNRLNRFKMATLLKISTDIERLNNVGNQLHQIKADKKLQNMKY